MRQLPDLHAILDVAEAMIVEHMDQKQRDRYYTESYRPELDSNVVPAGFDRASQLEAFKAFAAQGDD
jgi:hypothetical protein